MPCHSKSACDDCDCLDSSKDISAPAQVPTNTLNGNGITPNGNGILVDVTSTGAACEDNLVDRTLTHELVVGRANPESIDEFIDEPKLEAGDKLASLPKIIRNFSLVGKVCVVTG